MVPADRAKEEDEEKSAAEAPDVAEHAGEGPGVYFYALGVEVDIFTLGRGDVTNGDLLTHHQVPLCGVGFRPVHRRLESFGQVANGTPDGWSFGATPGRTESLFLIGRQQVAATGYTPTRPADAPCRCPGRLNARTDER